MIETGFKTYKQPAAFVALVFFLVLAAFPGSAHACMAIDFCPGPDEVYANTVERQSVEEYPAATSYLPDGTKVNVLRYTLTRRFRNGGTDKRYGIAVRDEHGRTISETFPASARLSEYFINRTRSMVESSSMSVERNEPYILGDCGADYLSCWFYSPDDDLVLKPDAGELARILATVRAPRAAEPEVPVVGEPAGEMTFARRGDARRVFVPEENLDGFISEPASPDHIRAAMRRLLTSWDYISLVLIMAAILLAAPAPIKLFFRLYQPSALWPALVFLPTVGFLTSAWSSAREASGFSLGNGYSAFIFSLLVVILVRYALRRNYEDWLVTFYWIVVLSAAVTFAVSSGHLLAGAIRRGNGLPDLFAFLYLLYDFELALLPVLLVFGFIRRRTRAQRDRQVIDTGIPPAAL
ncbi:MAG: hypothetical protein LBR29_09770 [Methylobacteriaceae bacterium]|nr:hypothetical protein [Methylobacteriaceae bacterium]